MEATFVRREDGFIEALLAPQWRPVQEAMFDAVGTRAPRGDDRGNPSLYWVDAALACCADPTSEGEDTPWLGGNDVQLHFRGDQVLVTSDHECFEDQLVPIVELVDLLTAYRHEILDERRRRGLSFS